MKVGVWINNDISPKHGGGFSYTSKLVELIDAYRFEELEVCFVSFDTIETSYSKEVVILDASIPKLSFLDKLKIRLKKKILGSSSASYTVKKHSLLNAHLNRQLTIKGVDVLYYLAQMEKHVPHFPFISTNWDLGHLSMPPFPETIENGVLEKRKYWYEKELPKASAVFVESAAGKKEMVSLLNYDAAKIMEVPIFPGAITALQIVANEEAKILKDFGLHEKRFFMYPAQFWEHKNHKKLIKAFSNFSEKHPDIQLVLSGSDKGMLSEITALATTLLISEQVQYLGFISNEELCVLYKNAIALVMPTFLGPTNMPLLEARMLGCPVVCSDFEGHKEQLGDGALYFNPNDVVAIEKCLIDIADDLVRSTVLQKATLEIKRSKFNEESAINAIVNNFKTLKRNRAL